MSCGLKKNVFEIERNLASLIPLSHPSPNFSVPSQNPVVPNSDFVPSTYNRSHHLSVAAKEDLNPITEYPSNQKSPLVNPSKFDVKNNTKFPDNPSVTGKDDESDTQQPSRAPTVRPAKNKQKKRRFSVVLTREEIEDDIAAIEALAGGKRLRRPKNRDPSCNRTDRRHIDHLFPGLRN
ncbi:hypothetical protein ES319_A07G019500v1 [Gossypium barbadense]|uniref:Uncharacterized protein n=1 Tax=Gossypium barbadense TaxID=3634 RepID=A0A5J5UYF7_GOSBA|nr:hypothetical protein ES319_A07G019500v1 [Gossypium barbadense]